MKKTPSSSTSPCSLDPERVELNAVEDVSSVEAKPDAMGLKETWVYDTGASTSVADLKYLPGATLKEAVGSRMKRFWRGTGGGDISN